MYDANGTWSAFFPLVQIVSGVGPFASGIFGTHMWRLRQGSALEFLHLRVVLAAFLAWAITTVYFLCVFCKFTCSSGVDFY